MVVGVFLGKCIWVGECPCQLPLVNSQQEGGGQKSLSTSATPELYQIHASKLLSKVRVSSLSTGGQHGAPEPQ